MIFTDRTIIVQKGTSSINDTIVLYRGDKEVEIRFSLNEGSPFRFGSGASPNIIEKTEAAYGQLIIKRPNDLPAVFSEIAPTNEGKIVFTITAEMIDEITEVGNYTFQIRLLDESKNSRATLPEVVNGIEIREPIATEDVTTTNEVGIATVGYALTTAGTQEDTFDSQGNYNKTTWGTGDRITDAKLNKIEAAIDGVNKKVASGGTGGNVDLSNYVTKGVGNASQIQFADGQTFQAKLDNGTLKGEKGDKGDKGERGLQGLQGDKGDKGDKGDAFTYEDFTPEQLTSLKGEKGDTGEQGIQGLKGDKGDKGDKGETGAKGEQGIQGIQGEKGDKGDKGDKGERGQDGLTTTISVNGTTYTHSNGTITLPNYPTVVSTANGITIADTAANFTATNVEGALAELFQFVSNGKTLIASAITDMGIATSNTDTFQVMANNIRSIIGNTGERLLYKFGLLSDVHVDGDGSDEASSISDLTNAISFLESAGANFIAYAGDMTCNGRAEDYTALKTCLQTSTVPNYCIRGNHDAYSLADGYASATGGKEDYIITQGNDLLIFISCADTNHDTGGLTTSKLDWLENLLQTNTNTRVFLFYHYFVNGTSGNGTGVYPWGTLKPSNAIASRFINMVKQYPNLIYCNGHSHMKFSIQDKDANANYYHNDGECYYIHVPSGAKPRYPDSSSGNGVTDYNAGSEGYLVEVYANKVLFKPIDFIASEYLTKYNYTANVVQGNNAPTVPAEPSTIDITWNDGIKIDKSTGVETSDSNYSASDFIAFDTGKTYTLNLTSSLSSYSASVFICYYDENKSFISCSSNYVGLYHSDSEVLTTELSIPSNAKYIKLRLSSPNVGAIDKSIITITTN